MWVSLRRSRVASPFPVWSSQHQVSTVLLEYWCGNGMLRPDLTLVTYIDIHTLLISTRTILLSLACIWRHRGYIDCFSPSSVWTKGTMRWIGDNSHNVHLITYLLLVHLFSISSYRCRCWSGELWAVVYTGRRQPVWCVRGCEDRWRVTDLRNPTGAERPAGLQYRIFLPADCYRNGRPGITTSLIVYRRNHTSVSIRINAINFDKHL